MRPPTLPAAIVPVLCGLLAAAGAVARAADGPPPAVESMRVPDGGVQPQAAVAADGTVHLIYLKGEPASAADVYYTRLDKGQTDWAKPIRVNRQPGAAIAAGTVRGAHLALGRGGWAHVAWMGSAKAEPKGPKDAAPMLYARLAPGAAAFEPERNVIADHYGLDGGGSVAADDAGNVYVAWHAPATKKGKDAKEDDRAVWVASSADDGKTFAPEWRLVDQPTGACGCCGMRLLAAGGHLYALYRSATEVVHRDIYLVDAVSRIAGGDNPAAVGPKAKVSAEEVGPWEIGKCVMSTASLRAGPPGAGGGQPVVVAAWERQEQIEWAKVGPAAAGPVRPVVVPGKGDNRKHPSVAVDAGGRVLVAWTEGTGWNKGGSVAWQVFGPDGKPIAGTAGRAAGLPAWGLPAAVVRADGRFVVIY